MKKENGGSGRRGGSWRSAWLAKPAAGWRRPIQRKLVRLAYQAAKQAGERRRRGGLAAA